MRYLVLVLLTATALRAQWIVSDPGNTVVNTAIKANQLAQHAEIMRQWAEELERLNRQLRFLEDQLDVARRIKQVAGDPSAAGGLMVLNGLHQDELARSYDETLRAVRQLSFALDTLKQTSDGIFQKLDDVTSLKSGFTRQEQYYRRFAVVEQQAAQLETVHAQADERSAMLQKEIAATLEQLKGASTQAEVDKLNGKLAALNGQLAEAAARRQQAGDQLRAQQILNENQAAKERQDLLERQLAEERQSLNAVGTWQRSIRLTPTDYTRP